MNPPTPTPPSDSAPPDDPVARLFPRAKSETERAYEAFRVYLQLGPRRRYLAVVRKVGAALSTVKRWAHDFDWRGRIKTYSAQSVELYAETEAAALREDLLDATARAQAFRERQYALAEALLASAESYLERVDESDLDQMSFADACKALEVASRLGAQAASRETDDPAASTRNLRDQLATLLDQAYDAAPPSNGSGSTTPPATAPPPPPTDH